MRWTPTRFASALVVARVALVLVIAAATGGREFTSDTEMWWSLASDPWVLLRGGETTYGQHPPVLPLLLAATMRPLRALLPAFFAVRFAMVLWEALAAWWTMNALRRMEASDEVRSAVAWLWLASPFAWFTTALWAQDEFVAAAWIAAMMNAWAGRRPVLACAIGSFGVVAGKAFVVLPLAVVLLAAPGPATLLAAVGPVLLVYGASWMAGDGGSGALASFVPHNRFGTSAWTLVTIVGFEDFRVQRAVSALLVGVSAVGVLGLARLRGAVGGVAEHRQAAAILLWLMVLFYHVNPEYYVLLLPVAGGMVDTSWRRRWAWWGVAGGIGWSINIVYGALRAGADAPGLKGRIARLLELVCPIDLATVHALLLVAFSAFGVAEALRLTRQVGRSSASQPVGPRRAPTR